MYSLLKYLKIDTDPVTLPRITYSLMLFSFIAPKLSKQVKNSFAYLIFYTSTSSVDKDFLFIFISKD